MILLKLFIIYFILFEFFFIFLLTNDFNINPHNIILVIFFIFIFLNYWLNSKKTKLDFDLLFKFTVFLLKTPNFFLNYFVNIIKKIYLYLTYFKYRHFFKSFILIFKKYSNTVLVLWRPLFKKVSYFGYYRSNRSKWIK